MPNTSATSGYLLPAPPDPLEGQSFEDFIQEVFVGITGLDPTLARPRWQEEPPNLPDATQTWMALGVVDWNPDTFAVEEHDPSGDGSSVLKRNEELVVKVSCYGPRAAELNSMLRDGLQIAQNREILDLNGVALIATGRPERVPALIKQKWQNRIDVDVQLRRAIRRVYPVLNLLSAQAILDNEKYLTNINV